MKWISGIAFPRCVGTAIGTLNCQCGGGGGSVRFGHVLAIARVGKTRVVLSCSLLLVVLPLAVSSLAVPASAATRNVTFGFTGGPQTFVVPTGVTAATFAVSGAWGGATGSGGAACCGSTATFTFTNLVPGESIQINVGGRGGGTTLVSGSNGTTALSPGGAGGFNGGATGGTAIATTTPGNGTIASGGGGGGGASDIRRGGTALANRVLVGAGSAGEGGSGS